MVSSGGKLASNCETVFVWPGKINSGAISPNGCSTNLRSGARGCGKINSGELLTSFPKAIKSKSSGRGSLRTFFGNRPNSFSRACNFFNKDSGVSSFRGTKPTTAFTNFGESGGQSTGVVCQKEDLRIGATEIFCNRASASKRICRESPRFEPSATMAKF